MPSTTRDGERRNLRHARGRDRLHESHRVERPCGPPAARAARLAPARGFGRGAAPGQCRPRAGPEARGLEPAPRAARDDEPRFPLGLEPKGGHMAAKKKAKKAAPKAAAKKGAAPQKKVVKPIPDGYHQVTPYLAIKGAAQAIDFYKKVFGAKERLR